MIRTFTMVNIASAMLPKCLKKKAQKNAYLQKLQWLKITSLFKVDKYVTRIVKTINDVE